MAKIGRNDPCPCGSGKKYKKCCNGKGAPSTSPEASASPSMGYQQAKALAEQWLDKTPLGRTKSKSQVLVQERFTVSDDSALARVKALGVVEESRVVFYQQKQWIGEADFSAPGVLLLTTGSKKDCDRLSKPLRKIKGLQFEERSVNEIGDLENYDPVAVQKEMAKFKQRFFQAWLDEKNDRLNGNTPRQAATSEELRPSLVALVEELEQREATRPKKERYSFKAIKKELGLD